MTRKVCKDCKEEWGGFPPPAASKRPTPYPGPRCATHHRAKKKAAREAAHANHIFKTYGITKEQYDELYERQGGTCYICQRATGASKRLAVDHDHKSGYVRGLLCAKCNEILGHFRDDDQAFERGGFYLRHPPAHRWIGKVKPNDQHSD